MQDSNQLPVRAGWQRATVDWVEGHVLGLPGAASQPFFINNQALNPTAEASCLDIIATHYVGSIDNQDPLALLLSGVNGAKGKWLAGDVNIAAAGNNLKQDMNNIREVQLLLFSSSSVSNQSAKLTLACPSSVCRCF